MTDFTKLSKIAPINLRCEYLQNPLGIDTQNPRFSWQLSSEERGQVQTAYRVIVTSSIDLLNLDRGDMWDSGKVGSGRSVNIVYEGSELTSGTRYFWKVICWDMDAVPSSSSEPAYFETGLFARHDWQGKWISAEEELQSPLFRKTFSAAGLT
jgi:alpha-L-rhamnosidase